MTETDDTNEKRVERAAMAIEIGVLDHENERDQLVDMLTNLRHYAEARGLDFVTCLDSSEMHWDAERSGGE